MLTENPEITNRVVLRYQALEQSGAGQDVGTLEGQIRKLFQQAKPVVEPSRKSPLYSGVVPHSIWYEGEKYYLIVRNGKIIDIIKKQD